MDKIIVSVRLKRNKQGFCRVELSTGEILELPTDVVVEHRLARGVVLSDILLQKATLQTGTMVARQKALRYATYKPRTEYQVRTALRDKELNDSQIEDAVSFLKEFGYLNDADYARMFISDFLKRKPSGLARIQMELKKRGVAPHLIEQALQLYYPNEPPFELALQAGEKKLRAVRHKPLNKQQESLTSYLQRQGFSWDIIKKVLSKLGFGKPITHTDDF